MSRDVDERILSMKFDADQFEKSVKETMKLLDEFDNKLDFKGAEAGIKNVSKAADKVDLSGLSKAAIVVEARFSAMSVAMMTALSNVVTSAQQAGTRIIKALSFDQINAGFDKYTQKTAAVQTIMNATGKTVEETTAALAKLQWFSDETSYSFVDMTSNVGKFTSAGVELNTAVSAMQGIANAAADAGATSVEASRAMYNFAQALAKGYVQLIDWKSIENANMATVTFKQTIIDSAASLGTLVKAENGYRVASGKAEVSATNFNDSLKDGWLTTEVLLDALGKYSAYSDYIYEVSDAFDTCAEAMAATSEEGMELGARAFKAAQQAKTFTEAIDATKDAVSSGWMESFEIIFGNFNESVELWTGFTNTLWDIFASGAEARNSVLRSGLSTGWNQLLNEYISDSESVKNNIISIARAQGVAIDDLIESTGSYEKSLKEGWLTADIFSKSLSAMVDDFENLSNEELLAKGYNEETVKSIFNLKDAIDEGTLSVDDLVDSLAKQSGRENIIEGLKNAYNALLSVIVPVKEAFREVFPPMTAERLYDLTVRFKNLTSQMGLSKEAAEGLKKIIRDLLVPVRIAWELIKGGVQIFGLLVYGIFNLLDALIALRNGAGPIPDFLKKLFGEERYTKILNFLSTAVEKVTDAFYKLKDAITGTKRETNIFESLTGFASTVVEFFKEKLSYIGNGLKKFGGYIIDFLKNIDLANVAVLLFGALLVVFSYKFLNFLTNIGNAISAIGSVASGLNTVFRDISKYLKSKVILDIALAVGVLAASIIGLSLIDTNKMLVSLAAVSGMFILLSTAVIVLSKTVAKSPEITKNLSIISLAMIGFSASILILTTAIARLQGIDFNAAADGVIIIAGLFLAMWGFISVVKSVDIEKVSKVAIYTIAFGVAVNVMARAIEKLSGIDYTAIRSNIDMIAVILLTLAGVAKLSEGFGKKSGAGLLLFVTSIVLLLTILKKLAGENMAVLVTGLVKLTPVLVAIYALMVSTRIAGENALKASAFIVAIGLSLNLLVSAIKKISGLSLSDVTNVSIIILAMTGALAVIMAMTNLTKDGMKGVGQLGVFAVGLSASVILLSVAIKLLGKLETSQVIKGTLAVSAVMGMFAIILKSSKDVKNSATTVIAMGVIIGALTVALALLGYVDAERLKKSVTALAIVLLSLAAVFKSLKEIKMTSAIGQAVGIGLILSAIVGSFIVLEGLKIENLMDKTKALSTLLLSLSIVMYAMSKIMNSSDKQKGKHKILNSLKNTVAMIIPMVTLLGVAIGALAIIDSAEINTSIEKITALSTFIIALSFAANISSKAIAKAGKSDHSIKDATAIFIEMVALGTVAVASLALLQGVDVSIEKVGALSLLIVALSTAAAISGTAIAKASKSDHSIKDATAIFIEMVALGTVAVIALAALNNVDVSIEKAGALGLLILSISGAIAILGSVKIPNNIPVLGILKIAGIITLIVAVAGAIAYALGALDKNGTLADTIDRGMDTLSTIMSGLGEMVGSLLSGIGVGLTSGLPEIGENIGKFGENVEPFLSAFNGLDGASLINGVDAIVSCILGITKNDILQGINSFFGGQNTTLEEFGENLITFGGKIMEFSDSISGLNQEALDRINTITEIVQALSDATPSVGGMVSWFKGNKDLSDFGEKLALFGGSFIQFYKSITEDGITIDESVVETVKNAALMMAALNDNIPATGGKLQDWLGEKNLGKFGESLALFGAGFVSFYNEIKDLDVDKKIVESVETAADGFAKINNKIPATGGELQKWIGNQDLDTWGSKLATFGGMFVTFYDTIKDLDVDQKQVNSVIKATEGIAALNEKLPPTDGLFASWFGGTADLGVYGDNLAAFGTGFSAFYASIQTYSNGGDMSEAVDGLMILVKAAVDASREITKTNKKGIANAADLGLALESFGNGLTAFYNSISGFDAVDFDPIASLETNGSELVQALIRGMNEYIPELKRMGTKSVASFILGVKTQNVESAALFIDTFMGYIRDRLGTENDNNSTVMRFQGYKVILGFKEGLNEGRHAILEEVYNLTQEVLDELDRGLDINSPSGKFKEAAQYCVEGFILGIKNNSNKAYKGVSVLTKGVLTRFKKDFEIRSPSRVMRDEVGRYIVDGIADGIESNMSAVEAASKMASNIIEAFKSEFDKWSLDQTTFDLEYQLWEAYNPDASEEAKTQQKLENLSKKISAQSERVNLAEAQYVATVKALGEESEQAQESYNTFLQEQITMATYANEMLTAQNSIIEATGKAYIDEYQEALAFVNENRETMLAGMSESAIEDYLNKKKQASKSDIFSGNSVSDIVQHYMSQTENAINGYGETIEVVLDTTFEEAFANASRGASGSAYGAGYGNGEDYANGVNDAASSGLDLKSAWEKLKSGDITGAIGDLGSSSGSEYANGTINGIIDGFSNGRKKVVGAVADFVGFGDNAFRKEAEIASPSKLMYRNGRWFVEGLINGITDQIPNLKRSGIEAAGVINESTDALDSSAFSGAIDDMIQNGSKELKNLSPYLSKAGGYVVSGFIDAIDNSDNISEIQMASSALGTAAISGCIDGLGERNGASSEFYTIASWIINGLTSGLFDEKEYLKDTMMNLWEYVLESVISVMENDDIQPVITPVIDSSWKDDLEDFRDTVLKINKDGKLIPYGYVNRPNDSEQNRKVIISNPSGTSWKDYNIDTRSEDALIDRVYNAVKDKDDSKSSNGQNNDQTGNTYTFNQYNTSPKPLSNAEIYRQTNNLFSRIKNSKA